jgi:hypothetical protein
MRNVIRINYIHKTASLVFWNEGPLLLRLLACRSNPI